MLAVPVDALSNACVGLKSTWSLSRARAYVAMATV